LPTTRADGGSLIPWAGEMPADNTLHVGQSGMFPTLCGPHAPANFGTTAPFL
jgi:hypothetical protein